MKNSTPKNATDVDKSGGESGAIQQSVRRFPFQTKRKRTPQEASDNEQPQEASDNEQPVEEEQISVVLKDESVLDCPICFEPFTIPVFQCVNGHVICSSCCDGVKQKCPTCDKEVGDIRCLAIENVLGAVKVNCSNKRYGCSEELSYLSKRSHQAKCEYAQFGCPFDECSFIGCQKQLPFHLTNTHSMSLVHLRFDHVRKIFMSKAEKFVVFCEEEYDKLFILNKSNRMSVRCIDGSEGDRFAYALVVRGQESCLRFQSFAGRIENTLTDGMGTILIEPSQDSVEVPSYLIDSNGCFKLELCLWGKNAPSVDITKGAIGEPCY